MGSSTDHVPDETWLAERPWQDHLMTSRPPDDPSADPFYEAELPALWQTANARMQRIYALRGQIISEVNGLEKWLDEAIGSYFGQPLLTSTQFRTWILGRLGLSDKIVILDAITAELGVGSRCSDTLTRLRRANDIRNREAHSFLTWNASIPELSKSTWPDFLKPHAQAFSRRQASFVPVDEEELALDLAFVKELLVEAVRILNATVTAAHGGDAALAIDEFDKNNADLMRGDKTARDED
jgi:hypothetical protein